MMKAALPAIAALFALAACGQSTPAENSAEALENAASQSDPAAAAVLENAADEVREQNTQTPPGAPGSAAQNAMQEAGNAQAATVAQSEAQPQGQPAPPVGAKPHQPGDPVPPPKIRPQ